MLVFGGKEHYIRGLSFFLVFVSHMYYLISVKRNYNKT